MTDSITAHFLDGARAYEGVLTYSGQIARVLEAIVQAGPEGYLLLQHDAWFASSVALLQRALRIEVISPDPSWRTNAAGARFVMRSEVTILEEKSGNEVFRGRVSQDDRPSSAIQTNSQFRFRHGGHGSRED